MPEFMASEVVANEPLAASEYNSWDLGVNGLSFLWFHITALQAANNVAVEPDDILAALDLITVSYNGVGIVSGRALELARLGAAITGVSPWLSQAAQAANAECGCSFFLPFGRKLFDPAEGFPAVQRGTLQCQVTAAASFGDVVTPELTIHQVEVPGNAFKRYNKYTQRTATAASTGNIDQPLPIGNILRGVQMRFAARWRNQNVPGSCRAVTLMINNAEKYYVGGYQGILQHLGAARMVPLAGLDQHAHISDVGAAYAQFQETRATRSGTIEFGAFYPYLDLDPTKDDAYSVDTKGLSELELRFDMAIADAYRVLPYESVLASGK